MPGSVRSEQHEHLTTVHAGWSFHLADVLDLFVDGVALIGTEIMVSVLATTEPHGDLDLVAVCEELADLFGLEVQVVTIGLWADLDLFDLGTGLALFTASLRLVLLPLELDPAPVANSADRRAGVRGHLDEIQAALFGELQGVPGDKLAQLLAGLVDQQDAGDSDLFVDSWLVNIAAWDGAA